jgi:ElaB/YqjD/DUF883 family membrane-anchored ribosome-binding protein
MTTRATEEKDMEQSVSVRADRTPPAGAPNGDDQAQGKAQEVASKAQQQVGEATGRAREQVRDQVNQRSSEAGERVQSTAADVRSVADELRRQGKDAPAKYAEQAAEKAERLGGYLHEADGDRILRDVEDFGRRNPWAVVAGGLALGFMASRLLKASSSERYRSAGVPQQARVDTGS